MPLGWRPPTTLFLTLQEALQLGEGSGAFQETKAGHFEVDVRRGWTEYEDGTKSFIMKVESQEADGTLVDETVVLSESPSEEQEGSSEHGNVIGSGTIGYAVFISQGSKTLDTIVGSYDELIAALEPFHPEPDRWEPGWQVEDLFLVSQRGEQPFRIEYHGHKPEIQESLRTIAKRDIGFKDVILTVTDKGFDTIFIDVTPSDETTVIEVATLIAKQLNLSLDDYIDHYDRAKES